MAEQNFKNHSRFVPLYHYILPLMILAFIIGSAINLFDCLHKSDALYSASLLCVAGPVLLILWWFSRSFALKAQDRAIRSEENLRYFIATGKALDSRLHMSQIIALRFAADDEFVALVQKAASENMSSKEIKAAIKNWKADYNRA